MGTGWGAHQLGSFSAGSCLVFTLSPRYPGGRQGSLLAAGGRQARRLLGELTGGRVPGFRVGMGKMVIPVT